MNLFAARSRVIDGSDVCCGAFPGPSARASPCRVADTSNTDRFGRISDLSHAVCALDVSESLSTLQSGRWPIYVGLNNFTHLFEDEFAVKSLWLTGLWALLVIILQMSLGTVLALLLDRAVLTAGLLRTLVTVPVFISPIAMGLTWRFMFEPVSGLVNWTLRQLGFSGSLAGCHPAQDMTTPECALVQRIVASLARPILLLTLAPELDGAEALIRWARSSGRLWRSATRRPGSRISGGLPTPAPRFAPISGTRSPRTCRTSTTR